MVEPFHSKVCIKVNQEVKRSLYMACSAYIWCLSCLTGSYIRIAHVLAHVVKGKT